MKYIALYLDFIFDLSSVLSRPKEFSTLHMWTLSANNFGNMREILEPNCWCQGKEILVIFRMKNNFWLVL
jgi:hypothetical protein